MIRTSRTAGAWAIGAAVVAVATALACGSDNSGTGGTGGNATPPPSQGVVGQTITIQNMTFSPLNLTVSPGAKVTVVNQDSVQHSVTSEASSGAFTPGAVAGISFDTGPFTGTATITIPANAPDGTVVPYYCTVHKSGMSTPNGTITISAAGATPTPTAAPVPTPSPNNPGGGY